MEKNLKVNMNHHHVSPTPRIYLIQVNVFSMNLLVKMPVVFSADGQYCKDITSSCTKLWMWCICISMCLVLCLFTGSVEIFISLLLSHQMTVGESNAKPSSPRIPYNHTHCVAVFISPLYSASVDERDIVCCFLLDRNMGPCASMNT